MIAMAVMAVMAMVVMTMMVMTMAGMTMAVMTIAVVATAKSCFEACDLLDVENLCIRLRTDRGAAKIVTVSAFRKSMHCVFRMIHVNFGVILQHAK